jgi:hypothetical protein
MQHADLSTQELDGARLAQEELEKSLSRTRFHGRQTTQCLSENYLDASADAKAARSITGHARRHCRHRIDRACEIVQGPSWLREPEGALSDVALVSFVPFFTESRDCSSADIR